MTLRGRWKRNIPSDGGSDEDLSRSDHDIRVIAQIGVSEETSSTKGSLINIQWFVSFKHETRTDGFGKDDSTASP